MHHSEKIDQIAAALATVQGQLAAAKKDKANPFFKSKYVDLAGVWEVCRDLLSGNGLAVVQGCSIPDGQGVVVDTMLCHKSGQFFKSQLFLPIPKSDPQAVGSAITYGRRYSLAAIVGVVPDDDDDAEGAMNRNGNAPSKQAPPKTAPAPKREVKATVPDPGLIPATTPAPEADQDRLLNSLKNAATDTALSGDSATAVERLRTWWTQAEADIARLDPARKAELATWCKNGAEPF